MNMIAPTIPETEASGDLHERLNHATRLKKSGKLADATIVCCQALARYPNEPALHLRLITILLKSDLPQDKVRRQILESFKAITAAHGQPHLESVDRKKVRSWFVDASVICQRKGWWKEQHASLKAYFLYEPENPKLRSWAFRHLSPKAVQGDGPPCP